MKMPDGAELDYFLQKFVSPVANPTPTASEQQQQQQKAVKQASAAGSFMRSAKRVTDFVNETKPAATTTSAAVAQASTSSNQWSRSNKNQTHLFYDRYSFQYCLRRR